FNEFIPASTAQWNLQRNKLAMVYGIIEESVEEFDIKGGEVNSIIQKNVKASGLEDNFLKDSGRELFNTGSYKLKRINGSAQKIAIDGRCFDLFAPFLRPPPL
ncbi:MAG: hypothetical protein KC478_17375, partial [Bacteriovoracaceae bacterium]|nr:hypothetical protein [Bacteriovoracaceae bacterium]